MSLALYVYGITHYQKQLKRTCLTISRARDQIFWTDFRNHIISTTNMLTSLC